MHEVEFRFLWSSMVSIGFLQQMAPPPDSLPSSPIAISVRITAQTSIRRCDLRATERNLNAKVFDVTCSACPRGLSYGLRAHERTTEHLLPVCTPYDSTQYSCLVTTCINTGNGNCSPYCGVTLLVPAPVQPSHMYQPPRGAFQM